jgi:hypothetical protein
MSDAAKFYLLMIINNKLPVDRLLDFGLDFSQIAIILSDLITEEYILDSGPEGLVLSDKGKHTLSNLSNSLSLDTNSKWILPNEKFRTKKIDIYDIYLPSKKV